MSADPGRHLSELQHRVIVAWRNYEVWWIYKGKHTRPKFIEAMNQYSLFFETSIHAHFVALLMALYQMYETRSDTFNISSLLRLLKSNETFDVATLAKLETMHDAAKPVWVKVNILRNNAFGHRSVHYTTEQAFKEAGLTANDLRSLIEHTRDLLNTASYAWDRSDLPFDLSAGEDLTRLLTDVSRQYGSSNT
jgi:HEPN superfamily AbiU2-like protein